MHFTGNIFRVQCKSNHTLSRKETKYNDLGWAEYLPLYPGLYSLGYTSESKMNVQKLSDIAQKGYHSTDFETLIIESEKSVSISWDGCDSFVNWSLDKIPSSDLVETSVEFEQCVSNTNQTLNWSHVKANIKNKGSIAEVCKLFKLEGQNKPIFTELDAKKTGFAQFKITSSGFKNFRALHLKTNDFGKTWKQELKN